MKTEITDGRLVLTPESASEAKALEAMAGAPLSARVTVCGGRVVEIVISEGRTKNHPPG